MLFPEQQRLDDFAAAVAKFNQSRRVAPLPRREQFKPPNLRRPDLLGLHDFQIAQLQQQSADLRKVCRIIAAFLHAPEIVLLRQIDFLRAVLDDDLRDIVHLKIAEQFLP